MHYQIICFIFHKTSFISLFYFLMSKYDFQKPCSKITIPTPVFCHCKHHASWFMSCLYKKIALIVGNKKWPTPAGWRLILSQQCWVYQVISVPSHPCPYLGTQFLTEARSRSSSITLIIYTVSYISKQQS